MDISELIVVKRSGQRVNFNGSKIAVAIKHAYDDVNQSNVKEINEVYSQVLKIVSNDYKTRKTINVEDIQDIIEQVLKNKNKVVYEAFYKYRNIRAESRKAFSLKQQHKFVKVVERVDNVSNIETPHNILLEYGEVISSEYTKSYILDNKYTRAHEEGKIYIHHLPHFNLGYLNDTHLIIDSKLDNLLNELLNCRTEIQGEIEISDLDLKIYKYELKIFLKIFLNKLIKYLKLIGLYDYVNIKKIEDKLKEVECIEFDIDIFHEFILNEQIKNLFIIAYKDSKEEYTNTLSDKINNLLLNLDGNIDNSKYAISLSNNDNYIKNVIIDEVVKLDYLSNTTILYKINNNYDIDTIYKLLNKNVKFIFDNKNYFPNGLLVDGYGKSNISNTSINIARLGIKYKSLNRDFYKELDDLIELTKNELLFVFETIGDKVLENYKVLFKNNILDDDKLEANQKVRKVIKNGTLNMNLVGLYECAYIIDKNNLNVIITKIISYIKEKLDNISKETKLNFTLSSIVDASNKEFIILDKTIYGIIDNVTKKDIYKNVTDIKIDDVKSIKYINMLNGGNLVRISYKNMTIKMLREIIDKSLNSIGILELRCLK